ncbi:MAG: hypothetical protein Q8K72_15955 [Acidimicrobiales bacterium]|nr:hypothetical protein [Acidimicrobiales bacterium]
MAAPAVLHVTAARRDQWAAFALLAVAVLLFLAFSSRMIGAPFGDSHDGRNAGVWAAGGRSLLDDGPLSTRMGTRSVENGVYANHPPLLYVETALFGAVAGDSPGAARAPAWMGTIAMLVLLSVLLLGAGLRPVAAGMALVLASVTPMLLVYGSMLDTPVASLPFGVAVLVAWERARRGRPVPAAVAGALTGLAVLSGWQSLLMAAVVSGWAAVRLGRGAPRPPDRSPPPGRRLPRRRGRGPGRPRRLAAVGVRVDPFAAVRAVPCPDRHLGLGIAQSTAGGDETRHDVDVRRGGSTGPPRCRVGAR